MADGRSIFISYSRADSNFAQEVRERLLGMGHAPWIDLFDIPAGARWPDAIDRALRSADVVLGIMSASSLASDNVKNEWDWAISNRKRLVLLLAESCDIPFHYVSLNYLDFTMTGRDGSFAQLGRAIGSAASLTPLPSSAAAVDGNVSPAPAAPVGARTSRLRAALHRGPARTAIVGRDEERELLRRCVDELVAGSGSLLLIGGEAGIGKTTLVNDITHEAEERGCLVVSGGCYDLSTTPPYGPWIETLSSYQRAGGLPPIPDSLRDEAGLRSIASQQALFEEVGEFFAEVAERRPLVIVLEDLHWSDPASLEFLRFFSRFLAGLPIVVIVSYREDELTRRHPLWELLPVLVREAPTERLSLRRLDADAVHELLDVRYHLPPPDQQRLAAHLLRLAEGNPFFTRELLQSLEEEGLLQRELGGWAMGDLARADIPPLVRQVIERRLGRLSESTRELLQVAAVIGQDVPYELWSAVTEASDDGLLAAVEQALDARLIEELAGGRGVRFYHALVREALYESVVSLRRRVWHRRVAEALIASRTPVADVVAHHLEQANDPRLVDWLVRAGEHAERRWSWVMAAERFDRAQRLMEHDPDRAAERAWLLIRTGLLWRYSRREESLAFIEEADRIATDVGDRLLQAQARANLGLLECFTGNIERGLASMGAGLAAFAELHAGDFPMAASDDEWRLSTGFGGAGTYALWLTCAGRFQEAEETLNQQEFGTDKASADAYGALGMMHAFRYGDADAAAAAYKKAGEVHLNINFRYQAYFAAYAELAFVLLPYHTDRVDARRRLSLSAHSLMADVVGSMTTIYMLPDIAHTIDWFLSGNWAGLRDLVTMYQPRLFFLTSDIPARFLYHAGEDDTLRRWIDQEFPHGPSTPPGNQTFADAVAIQLLAADVALDDGDLDTARAWLEAHDGWMAWSEAVLGLAEGRLGWARYYRVAGDLPQARQHGEASFRHASEPRQPLALIAAMRLLGELDTAEQRYVDAEGWLRESLALAEACEVPFERGLTLLAQAELAAARGETNEARSLLAVVREICERLGARPTMARVAALEAMLP